MRQFYGQANGITLKIDENRSTSCEFIIQMPQFEALYPSGDIERNDIL